MTRLPDLRTLAMAAGLALCAAVIVAFGLANLALAPRQGERLAGFERRLADLQRHSGDLKRQRPPPARAICTASAIEQSASLRREIEAHAAKLQLVVTRLDVAPGGEGGDGGLEPLRIRLDGSGGYEAVLGLLEALAELRPQIFVDTVDLATSSAAIELSFSGRAFCSHKSIS